MTQIDVNIVHKIFRKLKRFAKFYYDLGLLNSSMKLAQVASWWAYYFNISFRDDHLEKLLLLYSHHIKNNNNSYSAIKNKFVFYDSFALDNRGLTQQYMRALEAMNVEILFITDAKENSPNSREIIDEFNENKNVSIVYIPSHLGELRKSQYIFDKIIQFGASKIFMHLMPDAVCALTAITALPDEIVKYQINLTDHTFWLGASVLDYSFEFRQKGLNTSNKYRELAKDHLLLLPYYPIVGKSPFEGFPFTKKNDQVIVFSGGSFYKYYDNDRTFPSIIEMLLDENKEIIFVIAGFSEKETNGYFDSLLTEKYSNRFYFLGNRHDIAEVFNHCDIYMGSYPYSGGLMGLYAAYYWKPVVLLRNATSDGGEDLICQLKQKSFAYSSVNELCAGVKVLVNDSKERKKLGEEIHDCVMTKELFNEILTQMLKVHSNVLDIKDDSCLELPPMDSKIRLENTNHYCTKKMVGIARWRLLGVSTIFVRPVITREMQALKRKAKKLVHL